MAGSGGLAVWQVRTWPATSGSARSNETRDIMSDEQLEELERCGRFAILSPRERWALLVNGMIFAIRLSRCTREPLPSLPLTETPTDVDMEVGLSKIFGCRFEFDSSVLPALWSWLHPPLSHLPPPQDQRRGHGIHPPNRRLGS